MKTICVMRDVYKALALFETAFEKEYGLSLNEAMVLCALQEANQAMTSTALAERTEMSPSHTSKTIRSIETQGFIQRAMGEVDKRQMYFALTQTGEAQLQELQLEKIGVPELLKPLLKQY